MPIEWIIGKDSTDLTDPEPENIQEQPELRCCYNCRNFYMDEDGVCSCERENGDLTYRRSCNPTDICEDFILLTRVTRDQI